MSPGNSLPGDFFLKFPCVNPLADFTSLGVLPFLSAVAKDFESVEPPMDDDKRRENLENRKLKILGYPF